MKTKTLNRTLWIVQSLLALAFLLDGILEVFMPIGTLAHLFPWASAVPPMLIRAIGVCELLGSIGILVPPIVRILPWLAIGAASGFMLVVTCGAILHLSRHEYGAIVPNIVLFLLAAFVAYGRIALIPFPKVLSRPVLLKTEL
jgi:putative oxidoreductase